MAEPELAQTLKPREGLWRETDDLYIARSGQYLNSILLAFYNQGYFGAFQTRLVLIVIDSCPQCLVQLI